MACVLAARLPCASSLLQGVRAARELADRCGALLIFNEVISAFRFGTGDLGSSASARAWSRSARSPLEACRWQPWPAGATSLPLRQRGRQPGGVLGRYVLSPSGLAARRQDDGPYLVEHEAEIRPRLAELGTKMRRVITEAFAAEGVSARCTGEPNDLVPGCSLTAVHFPCGDETPLDWPHVLRDPAFCDTVLSQKALELALLLEDTYTLVGSFAASVAHGEADVERLGKLPRRRRDASDRICRPTIMVSSTSRRESPQCRSRVCVGLSVCFAVAITDSSLPPLFPKELSKVGIGGSG